jgi:UDP-N-acetylmuramate--alanine ligase
MQQLPVNGTIYFLGIGGIGMSALARYFLAKGWNVHGYDKTSTPLTEQLQTEGMKIHFEENTTLIPSQVDLVVYTPAVPTDHQEFIYFKKKNKSMMKRAEVLGLISQDYQTIGIAGTHGKTTTTTLVSHLLRQSEVDCQAFLGGISKNYNSNLLLSESSPYLVAEADEFDRSFLQLNPFIAVITSIDADHLDIYGDHSSMLNSFTEYSSNILPGGSLILKAGLELPLKLQQECTLYRYGVEGKGDFQATGIVLKEGLYQFDFAFPAGIWKNLVLGLPGLYNVENAVAALAVCWLCGVEEKEARKALLGFTGVSRRFDIRYRNREVIYIDDYAHHPAELKASIGSAKKLFPGKKISGIFQPHLFSRTRDFADEFAAALDLLDEIILLPIYPARELPIPGVDSEMLKNKIKQGNCRLAQKAEIPSILEVMNLQVLMTLGAGDIDTLAVPIENYLIKRFNQ